jgi:hypothetical protein
MITKIRMKYMLLSQMLIELERYKKYKIILIVLLAGVLVTCLSLLSRQSLFQFKRIDIEDEFRHFQIPTNQLEVNGIDIGNIGSFLEWTKIEIDLTGPESFGLSDNPNPFTIPVDVHFVSPDGKTIIVPAFYNGDGFGNLNGNQWKVHFSAGVAGDWNFSTVSVDPLLNGIEGNFTVTPSSDCNASTNEDMQNFLCTGRLKYADSHYLGFANKEYWIKGGIDDPENFLGNAFGDWDAKKDALDYLSSVGVNSIYVITNNIDGDRKDTWPWLGDTPDEAKANSKRFNLSKLQAWDDFFAYAQNKGIVLHIVLNDDSAWNGYDHALYYREMIGRFGYHPAVIWNIGEEANEIYTNQQQIDLADALQTLDPYDHPITVHRKADWPFLGDIHFDLTSIQIGDGASDFSSAVLGDYNKIVIDHREDSSNADHPIPIMIDETPRVTSVDQYSRVKMRTKVLYPIYLAGGNFEMHYYDIYGQGGSLTIRDLNPMLEDMRRARHFVETLPFNDMEPCQHLLKDDSINYCFQKPGSIYALYLSKGGSLNLDLSNVIGTFSKEWFNPRTGETTKSGVVIGGWTHTLTAPDNDDWALRLSLSNPVEYDFSIYLPVIKQIPFSSNSLWLACNK